MAKLGVYYGLCPLIDHRSFLGVTPDAESGNVIVTSGKNLSIKYKLSDQKQLCSWKTRDRFTSPVLYDREHEKYVSVFNQTYIRVWDGDEEDLDKLKKYKMEKHVHTIINTSDKTYVVFKDASILLLSAAIKNRKNLIQEEVVSESLQTIVDVFGTKFENKEYIGLLLKNAEENIFLFTTFNEENDVKVDQIQLKRNDTQLIGCFLHSSNTDVQLFTLWSDKKLYSYNLKNGSSPFSEKAELHSVIEHISCKHHATMVTLNKNCIAMYGCNSAEEGAVVLIYNLQFRVVQSRQTFKMFTEGAKLYEIQGNLLMCVGEHLAVIPYRLEVQKLGNLVGSKKVELKDDDDDDDVVLSTEVANWLENGKEMEVTSCIPERLMDKINEFASQGLSENMICKQLVPSFLENDNVILLSDALDYFEDFPEEMLAKALSYCLSSKAKVFDGTHTIIDGLPDGFASTFRCLLLNKILSKSFNGDRILPYLRRYLDLDSVLLAFSYIKYMLLSDEDLFRMDSIQLESRLIDWLCVMLDANYQKMLISKDTKIVEVLNEWSGVVKTHISYLNSLKNLLPLLHKVKKGTVFNKSQDLSSSKYSIEQLTLY